MFGFEIEDIIIVGYVVFSKQCGLYVDLGVILDYVDEIVLLKFKVFKIGVIFLVSKLIIDELIEKLVVFLCVKKGFQRFCNDMLNLGC